MDGREEVITLHVTVIVDNTATTALVVPAAQPMAYFTRIRKKYPCSCDDNYNCEHDEKDT